MTTWRSSPCCRRVIRLAGSYSHPADGSRFLFTHPDWNYVAALRLKQKPTPSGRGFLSAGRQRRNGGVRVPSPLHHAARCGIEQILQLLLVELRVAGGAVAGGLLAGGDEVKLAVLDLLHGALGEAGFRRIALVVGGIEGEQPSLDPVPPGRRVVIGGRTPRPQEVVGVGGHRRGETSIDQLVRQLACRPELLIIEGPAIGGDSVEGAGGLP